MSTRQGAASTPAVVIRAVEAGDVDEVVTLLRAVLAEFGLTFGEGSATDAQVLALPGSYRDHGGDFWVARDGDGGLLGTCGVFPVAPATFELRKMYLDARARGRGVGARLLDAAEGWCRARGGRHLVLDTTHQMTAAIAFYESRGFVRDDAQIRGSRCHRGYAKALWVRLFRGGRRRSAGIVRRHRRMTARAGFG